MRENACSFFASHPCTGGCPISPPSHPLSDSHSPSPILTSGPPKKLSNLREVQNRRSRSAGMQGQSQRGFAWMTTDGYSNAALGKEEKCCEDVGFCGSYMFEVSRENDSPPLQMQMHVCFDEVLYPSGIRQWGKGDTGDFAAELFLAGTRRTQWKAEGSRGRTRDFHATKICPSLQPTRQGGKGDANSSMTIQCWANRRAREGMPTSWGPDRRVQGGEVN